MIRESYISSLIKSGISKEKIMESYSISEEDYEEYNKEASSSSFPTEYQKKLMSGEIILKENISWEE